MANISPVTNLDFFATKEELKTFLKNQDRFADYDFDGSNMNVLLDLLAYNTFYNNYYYNMALSEMFLDSAQDRNSIMSHAKELNYLPRSRRSSVATVTLNITSAQDSNYFTIPANTSMTGKCGSTTFTFLTDKANIATRVGNTNVFNITGMHAFQGRLITETLPIADTVISNSFIDTSSLYVTVNGVEYIQKADIFGVRATDKVFYMQAEVDGKYSLQFGENKFGAQPTSADTILARYRICNGEEANGVSSFTIAQNLGGASSISAVVTIASTGGFYNESIESIRSFAPKALQVQDRAVTKSDYEILLRNKFPSIQAISVYGGDEVDPPQFGKVIISVDVTGGQGAADFEIADFREYLKDKTPLTIEPVFVSAKFLHVNTLVNIVYDANTTSKSAAQIKTEVIAKIISYQTTNLNDFNKTLRQSRLAATLDGVDTSIVSSDIFAQPIIEIKPTLAIVQNQSFSFEGALVKPYAFDSITGFTAFTPAFKTTLFTLEGTVVTLQDDGKGAIMAVTASGTSERVFKIKMGTVDYTTGAIKMSNLIVDSYEGDAIKFTANTVNKDVKAPKDRIISIRNQDITVNVTQLTE